MSLAELSEAILEPQSRFDGQVKAVLESIAEVFSKGVAPQREPSLAKAYKHLRRDQPDLRRPPHSAVLSLSSQVADSALALSREVSARRREVVSPFAHGNRAFSAPVSDRESQPVGRSS